MEESGIVIDGQEDFIVTKQNKERLEVHSKITRDAFSRFQKDRTYVVDRFSKLYGSQFRTSLEWRQHLREAFIAQARSYIGVPYSKKRHGPESPFHSSPIFLDCCGLVRQCIYDLRHLFGFTLGPGNQNAQIWN